MPRSPHGLPRRAPSHTSAVGSPGPTRCAGGECGLTLFELLVAMTISGILSGIAVVGYGNALHRARVAKAIAEIRMMEREMAKYELDYGFLPDTLAEIAWRAKDPWQRPYQYLRIQFKAGGNGSGNGSGSGDGHGNSPPPSGDADRSGLGGGNGGGSGSGGNGGGGNGGGGGSGSGGGGNGGGNGGGGNGGGNGGGGNGGGGNGGGGNGGGNGSGGNSGGCAGGHGHPPGARKDRFLVPINCDFDLYSVGPDGESKIPLTAKQSHDDIIRAGDGAYVGVASDF